MSQLSDNDFDKFFSDAFENLSEEPSPKVWLAVENDLNRQRLANKKMLLAKWSIAASIIICLTSVVIYFSDKHQFKGNEIALSKVKDPEPEKEQRNRAVIIQSPKNKTDETIIQPESKQLQKVPSKKKTSEQKPKERLQLQRDADTRLAHDQASNEPGLLMAVNDTKVIPSDQCIPEIQPKLLHQALVTESPSDGSAIPTIGDAMNYIAAKVDKRDKKFMAFNKSSGFRVNLGLLKIERKLQEEEDEVPVSDGGR